MDEPQCDKCGSPVRTAPGPDSGYKVSTADAEHRVLFWRHRRCATGAEILH